MSQENENDVGKSASCSVIKECRKSNDLFQGQLLAPLNSGTISIIIIIK